MNRKLIFLDIDGTLTPAGSNVIPDSALQAIRKAQANGHLVFLCTGRNRGMLAPVLAYGFEGAVATGGGFVFAGDEILFDCPMTDEQRDLGMRLLREQGVFRTIESRDTTWGDEDLGDFLSQAGEGNSELVRWRKALAEQLNILPMAEYDGQPIYKIVFMCYRMEQLRPAKDALEKDFNFVVQELSEHSCLNGELVNRKFDKGKGIRIMAEHFGADISDTIGFGDSMNDLEMIETVGTSVCMENGSEALKKIRDIVCPAVDQDGLYQAFLQLGRI